MSEFSQKARTWESNPIHAQRSEAIAKNLVDRVSINTNMNGMEFGAGTGLLSFILANRFNSITMIDSAEGMVEVMQEKVEESQHNNLKPLLFDLTEVAYEKGSFDAIFSQMALHHVSDVDAIFERFHSMLNSGGFLAIADLYTEDGSFHGEGFDGHNGFDALELEAKMKKAGFTNVQTETCFTMPKGTENYPLFLMIAIK